MTTRLSHPWYNLVDAIHACYNLVFSVWVNILYHDIMIYKMACWTIQIYEDILRCMHNTPMLYACTSLIIIAVGVVRV